MCTLSWWIAETERGIVFNRDELRTRSRGEAPRLVEGEEQSILILKPHIVAYLQRRILLV